MSWLQRVLNIKLWAHLAWSRSRYAGKAAVIAVATLYLLANLLTLIRLDPGRQRRIDSDPDEDVREVVRRWHKSDQRGRLPALSPLRDPSWKHYRRDQLSRWDLVSSQGSSVLPWLETLDKQVRLDFLARYGIPRDSSEASALARLGDMGSEAQVPLGRLHSEIKGKTENFQLNSVASDLMSLNRRLPDYRDPWCLDMELPSELPRASVIIVFHNEAKSVLLRTVHSVANRSPRGLLSEIILVDDATVNEELLADLDVHVAKMLPIQVKVVRLGSRQGLIRARQAGAKASSNSASVLVFLDAHIEVGHGWLEPLLSLIRRDRTTVALPVVDEIDMNTFRYQTLEDDHARGGLTLKLWHAWISSDPGFQEHRTQPFPTPTMIGCAFAVDKEFFFASGGYDLGMMIWGGENVEMSVRTWRCGGSLLVSPCSRVGHVYREKTPHSVPGSFETKKLLATKNSARFAKVWLDKYVGFFYLMNPEAKALDVGDITQRQALPIDLECHSFDWYLDTVYRDSPFPRNSSYIGEVKHVGLDMCLDTLASKDGDETGLRPCYGLGTSQILVLTRNQEIRNGGLCLDSSPSLVGHDPGTALFTQCNFNASQKWTFEPIRQNSSKTGINGLGRIVSLLDSGKCLNVKVAGSQEPSSKTGASGSTKGGKFGMLTFLGNLVINAKVSSDPQPVVEDCMRQEHDHEGQLWDLSSPSKWEQIDTSS